MKNRKTDKHKMTSLSEILISSRTHDGILNLSLSQNTPTHHTLLYRNKHNIVFQPHANKVFSK